MSRWMLERGMRNFVYLGRTGADKSSAKNLIQDLETAGAHAVVVRGDVTVFGDVVKAIAATDRVIGGVVHAAMGIHVRTSTDRPTTSEMLSNAIGFLVYKYVTIYLASGHQSKSSRCFEPAQRSSGTR